MTKKKKVLLTDDEPNIVRVVSARLKAHGYEVAEAYDGEEALAKIDTEKPDILLLDIMLPKMDGFEVCSRIRSSEAYRNIPIILFSAKTQEEDKKKGREVKADAYISKPFDPQRLIETIEHLLSKEPLL